MANIINGTDTGSGGLITTGDSSDELQIQTAETTALTITSGQQSAFIAGTAAAPAVTTTGDLNTGIYFPAADNIGFTTGGTIRGRWTTDGLCFGTDTAAANALDDYEEGTWTPVISDGTNNATMHASNGGTYIKVGKLVFIGAYVVQSSGGSVSGAIRVTGLPFTVAGRAGVTVARGESFSITAGQSVGIAPGQGTTFADLFLWDSSAGSTDFLASEFGSGISSLMFSLTYEASV
jgi:hypothetical protein